MTVGTIPTINVTQTFIDHVRVEAAHRTWTAYRRKVHTQTPVHRVQATPTNAMIVRQVSIIPVLLDSHTLAASACHPSL